jgi:hypothetical protein
MRKHGYELALTLAACMAFAPHVAGAEAPRDNLCSQAIPHLVDFQQASAGKDLAKIAAAARGAADAYQLCLSEAKTRTTEEPRWNYDRTRAAQFLVVEGRALAAIGDTKGAIQALQDARSLADDVVQWDGSGQTFSQSNNGSGYSTDRNTDRRGSQYKDAAKQVEAAALDELAKLNAPARRQASPAPGQSSPVPAKSPSP